MRRIASMRLSGLCARGAVAKDSISSNSDPCDKYLQDRIRGLIGGVICARAASCHLPLGFARSLASLGVPAPRLTLQPPAARCDAQTIVIEKLCEGDRRSLLVVIWHGGSYSKRRRFLLNGRGALGLCKDPNSPKSEAMEVLDPSPGYLNDLTSWGDVNAPITY